jgi:hypothetical protein
VERPKAEDDWARQARQWQTKSFWGGPGRGTVVRPHWQTAFIVTGVGTVARADGDRVLSRSSGKLRRLIADRADLNSDGNGGNALNAYCRRRQENKSAWIWMMRVCSVSEDLSSEASRTENF